jgi:hypothetical protein
MIEIGPNPDSPLAVIFHSTESGRFMPASRTELEGLIDAMKRGVFDPMIRDLSASAAAWTAEQVAEQQEWDRAHPKGVLSA